jgi:hypothetical protein
MLTGRHQFACGAGAGPQRRCAGSLLGEAAGSYAEVRGTQRQPAVLEAPVAAGHSHRQRDEYQSWCNAITGSMRDARCAERTSSAFYGSRFQLPHRKFSTSINSSTDESTREKITIRPSRDALRPGPTAPRLRATVVDPRVEKSKHWSRASPTAATHAFRLPSI